MTLTDAPAALSRLQKCKLCELSNNYSVGGIYLIKRLTSILNVNTELKDNICVPSFSNDSNKQSQNKYVTTGDMRPSISIISQFS